ncbi:hypothetical protein [Streptomyces lydicus]|uniref:hypothetical protein n=1 Tax=Streptomyces lydicus TaxID=47763 RepID=UPI001011F462|nr:hypothetical protein [Streptomyces lydicus]MCZ1012246.1 hypothetical protein [Streptomyces lydicus]
MARETEQLLVRAAPVIEQVTGLDLPHLCFRILSPRAWRAEMLAYVDQARLQAATMRPRLSPEQLVEHDRIRADYAEDYARKRATYPAATVTAEDGTPQTLIAPGALHRAALRNNPRALYRVLIHESVHQGQDTASRGAVAPVSPLSRDLVVEGKAIRHLLEGHAEWAERRVTQILFGGQETPRPSEHAPQAENTRGTPAHDRQELHAAGVQFVEAAVAAAGDVQRFNKIWRDRSCVPTVQELSRPDAWSRRVGL